MNFQTLPVNDPMVWSDNLSYWLRNPGNLICEEYIKNPDGNVYVRDRHGVNATPWKLVIVPQAQLLDNGWK